MLTHLRLTLGPLLYNWPAERRLAFYRAIATESPYDDVILGEVVCAKRNPFVAEVTLEAARLLEAAGKRVIYTTLALPVQRRERADMADVCGMAEGGGMVEANEAGALFLLRGQPHRVGPFFNTYNADTVAVLADQGAAAICLPWELDLAAIQALATAGSARGVDMEVPVFGSTPLAISARCYHARAHGLAKDGCQYVCGGDAEGLSVETLDGERFLRVNGMQTLSDTLLLAVREIAAMAAAGVTALRITPEAVDMGSVGWVYRDVLDGRLESAEALDRLHGLLGARAHSNGYLRGAAGAEWRDADATA